MPQITSFVFFDLETTGLPWQERNQTKIIELSFVVALRKDIETTAFGNVPPVSKLSFVVHPQKEIHPQVTHLTGLSNELLIHAPVFRQKIKSVISFLNDLPMPVCLVAHNGNSFDFKILLAEFNDASASLPLDLLCVDSLVGFRTLLKGTDVNYQTLLTIKNMEITSSSSVDDLLTDDEDYWPDLNVSTEQWQEIDDICVSLSDVSCEDFTDAEHNEQSKKIKSAKQTKAIKIKSAKRTKAIKNVFDKKPRSTKNKVADKDTYTLSALYKRLLNKEESNAHRAEADCLMLVQCVVALKHKFLPWADQACKPLTEIKPLVRY